MAGIIGKIKHTFFLKIFCNYSIRWESVSLWRVRREKVEVLVHLLHSTLCSTTSLYLFYSVLKARLLLFKYHTSTCKTLLFHEFQKMRLLALCYFCVAVFALALFTSRSCKLIKPYISYPTTFVPTKLVWGYWKPKLTTTQFLHPSSSQSSMAVNIVKTVSWRKYVQILIQNYTSTPLRPWYRWTITTNTFALSFSPMLPIRLIFLFYAQSLYSNLMSTIYALEQVVIRRKQRFPFRLLAVFCWLCAWSGQVFSNWPYKILSLHIFLLLLAPSWWMRTSYFVSLSTLCSVIKKRISGSVWPIVTITKVSWMVKRVWGEKLAIWNAFWMIDWTRSRCTGFGLYRSESCSMWIYSCFIRLILLECGRETGLTMAELGFIAGASTVGVFGDQWCELGF